MDFIFILLPNTHFYELIDNKNQSQRALLAPNLLVEESTSEGAEPSESALRHQSVVMENITSECDRTRLRSQLSHFLVG